jgi:hypothetical protein
MGILAQIDRTGATDAILRAWVPAFADEPPWA